MAIEGSLLCVDVLDEKVTSVTAPAASVKGNEDTLAFLCNLDKLWSNTSANKTIELKVYFMKEHEKEKDILCWMSEWSEHCGVIFEDTKYIDGSQIRVDFNTKGVSRTRIGTTANEWPREWTMTLGWVDRPTILHETGHVLGLLHEHQSPFTPEPILWNERQIIKDLDGIWTEEDIKRNIINKYSCDDTYDGYYDPDTIMKYPIHPTWIKPETKHRDLLIKRNTELSVWDKKLIGLLYPKPNLTRVKENPQDILLHQLPLSIVRPRRDRIEADSVEVRHKPIATVAAVDNILQMHLEMKHLNEILPYVRDIGDDDLRRLGLALGLLFPSLKRMRNLPEDLTFAWLNRQENVLQESGEPTYERLAAAMEEIGQNGMALDVRNQRHAKPIKK